MPRKYIILIGFAVAILLVIGIVLYINKASGNALSNLTIGRLSDNISQNIALNENEEKTSTQKEIDLTKNGIISGVLDGSVIPSPSITVCAKNTKSKLDICTESIDVSSSAGISIPYQLGVPEGEYKIYAFTINHDYVLLYSEYIVCGMTENCTSREASPIYVNVGDVIPDINPNDIQGNIESL